VGLFPVERRIQFQSAATVFPRDNGEMLKQLRAYAAAPVLFVNNQFIHITDDTLLPQIVFNGKGSESDHRFIALEAKIEPRPRRKDSFVYCPQCFSVNGFIRPQLAKQPNELLEIPACAFSYARHGIFLG
jgi:hypothetical protein